MPLKPNTLIKLRNRLCSHSSTKNQWSCLYLSFRTAQLLPLLFLNRFRILLIRDLNVFEIRQSNGFLGCTNHLKVEYIKWTPHGCLEVSMQNPNL